MERSLLYRWFGVGKMPSEYSSRLSGEGIVIADEGVAGWITYRNFRSPARISSYRKKGVIVWLAVTSRSLLVYSGREPLFDVELADERLAQVNFLLGGDGTLLASHDASLFHSDWSGDLEYSFRTPHAAAILDKVRASS